MHCEEGGRGRERGKEGGREGGGGTLFVNCAARKSGGVHLMGEGGREGGHCTSRAGVDVDIHYVYSMCVIVDVLP